MSSFVRPRRVLSDASTALSLRQKTTYGGARSPVYYKLDAHGRFAEPGVEMLPIDAAGGLSSQKDRGRGEIYVLCDLSTDFDSDDRFLYETGVVQTRDGEPLDAPPLAWRTVSYGSRSISPPPDPVLHPGQLALAIWI